VEIEERMAICENEMKLLTDNMSRCEHLVESMLEEQKAYSKKYSSFLDMLIEDKMESKRLRDRAFDSAASGMAWAGITFLAMAVWYFIKEQIKK